MTQASGPVPTLVSSDAYESPFRAQLLHPDRGLRVPVRLRDLLPGRAQRGGGVDVRAPPGLPQHLRGDARPRRRQLPARTLGRAGAGRAALPSRQPDDRDHLADAYGLADRARRADDGPLAQRGRALQDPPALPHRHGRRALPAADRQVRQRIGGPVGDLRADVRLRQRGTGLGVRRDGVRRGGGHLPGRIGRDHAAADHRPAARDRGAHRPGAHPDDRGRQRLRRAQLVLAAAAADLRGGRRPDVAHLGVLAAVDHPGRVPRPPVADPPAAQRADPQGPDLRADRRAARRLDDLAARDPARRTQLGLPLRLDPRLDVRAVGPVHPGPGPRGQRLLLLHRRREPGGARPADHVRRRRRARPHRVAPCPTSPATRARVRCGSATAPTTSASTTSGARCSTRSICTSTPASSCRRACGRCSSTRWSARSSTGASPTAASGRYAASRSTSPRPS